MTIKAVELLQDVAQYSKQDSKAAIAVKAAFAAEASAKTAYEKAQAGGWKTLVRAVEKDGATFDGMEAAEESLKEMGSYRSRKSVITQARKYAVPLMTDGDKPQPRKRNDVWKDITAKKAAEAAKDAPPKDNSDTGNAGEGPATVAGVDVDGIARVLATLKDSAVLRAQYGAELIELTNMLADDASIPEEEKAAA